jgi:GNAT superfamily N-acetyltransferase
MDIIYRPATINDLEPAARLVQQALNGLRVQHGLMATAPLRSPLFQRFSLAEDPTGLWVADAGDTVVGFGFSWVRQKFWYLSQLFIRPDMQTKGVGQELLSQTLRQGEQNGTENRALTTFAFNTISTGLYVRNGIFPREPLYRVVAPAPVVERKIKPAGCLDALPIEPWPQSEDWLAEIDEQVLGFRRGSHHEFLLSGFAVRAARIDRAGRQAGYAYVSGEGHIGPIAISQDADAKQVVQTAIYYALQGRPDQISLIVPGKADQVMGLVTELGFRLEDPMVLMSALPFGDWSHYLPSNPGYM